MNDTISRQQTIAALRALSDENGYINAPHEVVTDVVRGLPPVQAEHGQTTQSEQGDSDKFGVKISETCEDCISRQAAIDALHMHLMYRMGTDSNKKRLDEWINNLPSAQPERLTDYSFEESCTECPAYDTENHRCPRFNQVIRTALKDANLEPCENCISRQEAIEAVECLPNCYNGYSDTYDKSCFIGLLEDLPSVQPEIIRCKDCQYQSKGQNECETWNLCGCRPWQYTPTTDEHFCGYAERRQDEQI